MFSIRKLKKLLLPKTLLTRFVLIIIVPILVGQSIAIHLFYDKHWYNVANHISTLVIQEIDHLLNSKEYLKYPNSQKRYINIEYKFTKNKTIPNSPQTYIEEAKIFEKNLKAVTGQKGNVLIKNAGNVVLYIQLDHDMLSIDLPYKSVLNPTTDIFVLWMFFLTILLLTVSLIFSKNQIRSIIELTKAAENYGKGNKTDQYKPSGAKEIRRAGLAFLKMRDRIKRQAAKRTQMLAMISHDLKTPLTRMKLQVELMENSEEKEELIYDINSMQQMIISYLDFARGEGGEELQATDLNSWFLNFIQDRWVKSNIELKTEDKPITVNIKPFAFERAISNLISNALRHSTKIEVTVYSENENAICLIEDNGSGIKEEERNLVFRPFYRSDKSRSLDNAASVGLGLAITKEIINGHFGSIKLADGKKLKGLLVKIKLPIK
jgi:two-component system, OmpR family, osmolarity sensor histidine kinase EnvZ